MQYKIWILDGTWAWVVAAINSDMQVDLQITHHCDKSFAQN